MAETMQSLAFTNPKKRGPPDNEEEEFIAGAMVAPKRAARNDPAGALANARHEFGEHGGVNMSIEASATFTVMEADTLRRMFAGELGPDRDFFIYSRHCNPTVMNLGRQMAALEGTEAAYCTSSGMAAISSVLIQLCGAGGRVVASRCLYGGTHALLAHFLPRACGIRAEFVDIGDIEAVRAAIRSDKEATRVLYVESVSNPTLAVADVPRLSAVAKEEGVKLVVDNTFTPMVLSPARLGADVVLHSVSKFISGGGDVIAEHARAMAARPAAAFEAQGPIPFIDFGGRASEAQAPCFTGWWTRFWGPWGFPISARFFQTRILSGGVRILPSS